MHLMNKIDIVESYINRCTEEHTMESDKKLVNNILGVFSNYIDGITLNLDLFDYSRISSLRTVDYIGDVSLLKENLNFTRHL